jgi:gamma-glutamylputrescine oxidase
MEKYNKNFGSRRNFLKTSATVGAAVAASAAAANAAFPRLLPEKVSFEKNQSYWAATLPSVNPSLEEDIEADVAVIGGGFTGLSASYFLKLNWGGDRVVLLEASRCGNGASGRNGAMLLTSTEDRYMEWSGDPALDKRIYDLTVENSRRLLALSVELNFDAEIELNGALQMCNSKEIADRGLEYIEKARRSGFPFEFWDKQKISQLVGTRAYPAALFDPNSGQLHPGKLVGLFKAAATYVGVEIYDATPVSHVEEGERITLTTADGRTIRARSAVLATNAYSSKLGYFRQAFTPVFDYVGMTAPLPDARLTQIGWNARIPFNDSRTEVYYLGLTRDNRIHIGGGPVDYVFNNGLQEPPGSEYHFDILRRELARIFPTLADEPLEMTWSGAVDMSIDQSSSVGQMGKHGNIFYAIGFSGHGVNLTSIYGRVLADLVHGQAKNWSWLPYLNRPLPYIPNEPFRWLGIHAALNYYRITDPKQP